MLILLIVMIPTLAWGMQDVLIKTSANTGDKFYLKVAACYGITCLPLLILGTFFSESGEGIVKLISSNKIITISYIAYTVILFIDVFGAKFLEASIYSPIESLDGCMTLLLFIGYFFFTGNIEKLNESLNVANILGVVFAFVGIFALAALQNKYSKQEKIREGQNEENNIEKNEEKNENVVGKTRKKHRYGAWALLFPLTFCLIDGFSTFVDSLALGAGGEQILGEMDFYRIITSIIMLFSLVAWIALLIIDKKMFNPFKKKYIPFFLVAILDILATAVYPYALKEGTTLAIVAFNAYSVITVLMSRFILKEKMTKKQYLCIASILIGILLLTFAEIN